MESASLTIGVVALAGLYTLCLDVFEQASSYKSFHADARDLDAQFRAERVRLARWGPRVGFGKEGLLPNHHPHFDDARVQCAVEDLFNTIKDILQPEVSGEQEQDFLRDRQPKDRNNTSRWQKFAWAVRGKGVRTKQADLLNKSIQSLHELVPVDEDNNHVVVHRVDELRAIVREHQTNIRSLMSRLSESAEAEEKYLINNWLCNGVIRLNTFEHYISHRLEGTCDWIITHPTFLEWLSDESRQSELNTLWIHGPPGFGKSYLCASIVQHLKEMNREKHNMPIAYFFSKDDIQRGDCLLPIRSWISQIAAACPSAANLLRKRWLESQLPIGEKSLRNFFMDILKEVPKCLLIIDGLDEYSDLKHDTNKSQASILLDMVREAAIDSTTRLLIVSQDTYHVRAAIMRRQQTGPLEIKLVAEDVAADIIRFSTSIVEDKLSDKDKATQASIIQRLSDRCQGQFLWLRLLEEEFFEEGLNKKQIERAIEQIPRRIEELYERSWNEIQQKPPGKKSRALRILRWVTFSVRPLTVGEITEAVLIDTSCEDFPVDELPDAINESFVNARILGLCASLLEAPMGSLDTRVEERIMQLTHFSAKEFLIIKLSSHTPFNASEKKLQQIEQARQNSLLAKLCLQFVNSRSTWKVATPAKQVLFKDYAVGSWYQHANSGTPTDDGINTLINQLFDTTGLIWSSWRSWYDAELSGRSQEELASEEKPPEPLYYACELGLTDTVCQILKHNTSSINARSSLGRNALYTASIQGYYLICEQLLKAGADFTVTNQKGDTPLAGAVLSGNAQLVELLLDYGCDAAMANELGIAAVGQAAGQGNIGIIEMILQRNPDKIAQFKHEPALVVASYDGHLDVVKLLLAKGWDAWAPITRHKLTMSPIWAASSSGHLEIVRCLLEHGETSLANGKACDQGIDEANTKASCNAKIDTTTLKGYTPVTVAASNGHVRVVELLLQHGANVNGVQPEGIPIKSASEGGHLEVVQLLLRRGAEVTGPKTKLLMHTASYGGNCAILELFTSRGLDVNALDDHGTAPLHIASYAGRLDAVRFLLDNGANVSTSNKEGWTPLHAACSEGHSDIVESLLQAKSDILATTRNGCTPLHIASYKGYVNAIKLLLDSGLDAGINISQEDGWTPIHAASENGHLDVVELLIEKGANTNLVTEEGYTLLHIASKKGHVDMSRLLHAHGVNINSRDRMGATPLTSAIVNNGQVGTIQTLLDLGADPHERSSEAPPIIRAIFQDHTAIVRLLHTYGVDIDEPIGTPPPLMPLSVAINKGSIEIIKCLLDLGANAMASQDGYEAPLITAISSRKVEVIELLLEYGANVVTIPGSRNTPLHFASYEGDVEIVQFLLGRGAKVDVRCGDGKTPIQVANEGGHARIAALLAQHEADNSLRGVEESPLEEI